MSTVSVPNTFTNGNVNDGPQVSANFNALVSYINTNCIVADATISLSAALSCSTAPSSGNHLTNKTYVDGLVGRTSNYATSSHVLTANDTFQTIDTLSFANPGKAIVVEAWGSVTQVGGAGTVPYRARIGINMTGSTADADFTWSTVQYATIRSGEFYSFAPFVRLAGTPSGIVRIRLQHYQTSGAISFGQASEAAIMYDAFKTVGL